MAVRLELIPQLICNARGQCIASETEKVKRAKNTQIVYS